MGCCSVTARGTNSKQDGHEEVELLQTEGSRKQSEAGSLAPSGGTYFISRHQATGAENELSVKALISDHSQADDKRLISEPVLFWGKSHANLNGMILSEPIRGWEGQDIQNYGKVVRSSLIVMQISGTQEILECFLVLFPFHLLILSLDHQERRFIYQGLLPLSGMRVYCLWTSRGHTFEISGPMIEARQISCLSSNERDLWISALQHHILGANTHYPPIYPSINILSFLLPCDSMWKKRELLRYLISCPIKNWEGKAIHHLGNAIYLSAVRVAHTIDADFEDRLLVLFSEDLVFLSIDAEKTAVTHQGTLPLNAIHIEESNTWDGRLEFQIAGQLMEPILVSCSTIGDYNHLVFYLQKPEESNCAISLSPLPIVPVKYGRR
ncbi:hypothetical protein XENTR_v10018867 [Xenopus tropicalis]|uniref:Pleckstrin homology domain-containing family N member 1 isoform X1 n=1 Tax=Xenopus tropicalis TaxID=8364 RepID=A0A8J0QYM4_XENTR|nr:pleckstrin homology domain-containing family N member 1 isoform X1 [Xenopus tropicalis]KAE8592726.1 hypothetical protein XENTR_v10018867 [Xenopus tropicalis]